MKLKELKKHVDNALKYSQREGDEEVCIPNNKSGMMGGTPATPVNGAYAGFDWNLGKFFIHPKV